MIREKHLYLLNVDVPDILKDIVEKMSTGVLRWIKLGGPLKPKHLRYFLRDFKLRKFCLTTFIRVTECFFLMLELQIKFQSCVVCRVIISACRPQPEEPVPLYEATVAMETIQRHHKPKAIVQL